MKNKTKIPDIKIEKFLIDADEAFRVCDLVKSEDPDYEFDLELRKQVKKLQELISKYYEK